MPTVLYSTMAVPERERFDYWRETLCLNFYGMTPQREAARSIQTFDATLKTITFADAALVEVKACSHICLRGEHEIAERPGDSMYVYLQKRSGAWFDTPDDRQPFVTDTGAMAIGFSDRPMRTAPTAGGRFDFQLVRIPLARVTPFLDRPPTIRARALDMRSSMTALVRGYFELLVREAPSMDAPTAEVATQTLARLTAVAYGLASPQHEAMRDAVREAKRRRVSAFIERHARRPDLSPALAARALAMSVRQLHGLLEPTGASFAQLVRMHRIQHARQMVISHPEMKIADIGLACGFDSVGTFHRVFRQAFGMTPGELRAAFASSPPAADADARSEDSGTAAE